MAQFTTSFLAMDQNMDVMNYFAEQNHFANLNFQSPIMGLSMDNLFMQQPPPHDQFQENFPGIFNQHEDTKNHVLLPSPVNSGGCGIQESNKRKEAMEDLPGSSSGYSEDGGIKSKNMSSGGGKRRKRNERQGEEKGKEVVHVRARRGQATDSHSLAERVRRGKINERLKCLQGIVPGCYKTMGMSVMLDEIINYVQSLQNQVEFLSMRLNAASTLHDFNLETNTAETIQRIQAFEAEKMQGLVATERYEGLVAPTTSQLDSFGLTFGSHSSLPYNI